MNGAFTRSQLREGFADLGCSVTLGTTTGIAMGKEESLSNVCTCTEWCERNQHSWEEACLASRSVQNQSTQCPASPSAASTDVTSPSLGSSILKLLNRRLYAKSGTQYLPGP